MSSTLDGVSYPREVPSPPGLPPGWKAIERAYSASSKSFGKTYIRYDSPNGKHKTVGSVRMCVQKDAEDKGLNVAVALKAFDKAIQDAKEAKQKEREEAGQLAGAKREEAVEAFRARYGELNGATVSKLPGWRAESIYREACGQTSVTYYSPDGRAYGAVKSVEAFFGMQVLAGRNIPIIEEARARVLMDENGRPINEARQEINYQRTLDGEIQVQKRPKTSFNEEDYRECRLLVAPTRDSLKDKRLDAAGLPAAEREALQSSASELLRRLVAERRFEAPPAEDSAGLVLAVLGCPAGHQLAGLLGGLFYRMAEPWNGRPCYQRVFAAPRGALACSGVYIFWSPDRRCWKIGPLNDAKVGWAFCADDRPRPTEVEASWRIYTPS